MKDSRARKFDVVIVARFDRFARSVSHLLLALEEFNHLDIDFVSLSESIDTSTPMGKMIFTVLGAVAELERNLIKERVHLGISRARKQGKPLGRPKRIFDQDKARTLLQTMSIRQVAREMGVSRGVIRRVLSPTRERSVFGYTSTDCAGRDKSRRDGYRLPRQGRNCRCDRFRFD